MMKSYFGAMALNISRISRVSWRSTGVPMIRFAANLTRIGARESELIFRAKLALRLRGSREQSRQILLRHSAFLPIWLATWRRSACTVAGRCRSVPASKLSACRSRRKRSHPAGCVVAGIDRS